MDERATFTGTDGRARCRWCMATPQYQDYHDTEWGFPVADDRRLFEKLCLEGFQSGLSWRTILQKRENFRAAFHGFDFLKISAYGPADMQRLLGDAGIVRHQGKIAAVINNARLMPALIEQEGSLAAFIWRYEPEPVISSGAPPARSVESTALSNALKKRGWQFVGPTTMYAFMQSMGLINDHASDCASHAEAERARAVFQRPV